MKLVINNVEQCETLDYYSYEQDTAHDNRQTIYLVLDIDINTAITLFQDNINWGGYIYYFNENNEQQYEYIDFSEYCIFETLQLNKNNTITICMAQKTELEKLQDSVLVTKEEAEAAYLEGINES